MIRWLVASWVALAACSSSNNGKPIDLPVVQPGEHEADCQRLCALPAGSHTCTATHQAFCVASCRERTTGLAPSCATCVIDAGTQLMDGVDGLGDAFCSSGGPASLSACETECDDHGSAPPAPSLDALCDLECGFYMEDATPLACSDAGSMDCRGACSVAIANDGRICAQCLAEQTSKSRTCLDQDCDCDPGFPSDMTPCAALCDTM